MSTSFPWLLDVKVRRLGNEVGLMSDSEAANGGVLGNSCSYLPADKLSIEFSVQIHLICQERTYIFLEYLILPGEKITSSRTPVFAKSYIVIFSQNTYHFSRRNNMKFLLRTPDSARKATFAFLLEYRDFLAPIRGTSSLAAFPGSIMII